MKKAGFALLVIGLTASMAAPAAAGTSRYLFECTEHLASQPVDGAAWIEDGALQLRGSIFVYDVVGDPLCAGELTVVVNFNLDLTTESGALWGTATKLNSSGGGFDITWNAHWTASSPLDGDAVDIWAGQYVGQGFGDLAGWQARGTIEEETHVLVNEAGYAFHPGT